MLINLNYSYIDEHEVQHEQLVFESRHFDHDHL